MNQVFLFRADHATALKRENENKLIDEPGITMNEEFLQQLNDAYDIVSKRYVGMMPSLIVIDTSESAVTSPRSTAYGIADSIVKLLEDKLANHAF